MYFTLGWSDLALFSIFVNLHIYVDQKFDNFTLLSLVCKDRQGYRVQMYPFVINGTTPISNRQKDNAQLKLV